MKNWLRNIKQEQFGWLLFSGFMLSLGVSLLAPMQFELNALSQQMLWGMTLILLCIGVAGGIVFYIDKSTRCHQEVKNALKDEWDTTFIRLFLQTQSKKTERATFLLKEIQNHISIIAPRMHELDVEQQHYVERLINKQLRDLLTHYQHASVKGQSDLANELLASLVYTEGTMREVYVKQLQEQSKVQFKKTRHLLVK